MSTTGSRANGWPPDAAYGRFAKSYYRDADGVPTRSRDRVNAALRLLRQPYAAVTVCEFGPLALQSLQQKMAADGKARTYVNSIMNLSEIYAEKNLDLAAEIMRKIG